jgi:hypothetical protein
MSFEWAFCHSIVSEITQGDASSLSAKYSPSLDTPPSCQSRLELGWREPGKGAQSLGYVMFDTLHRVASGSARGKSITRASERRHEHVVMGQMPVALAQSARFSPKCGRGDYDLAC